MIAGDIAGDLNHAINELEPDDASDAEPTPQRLR